MICVVVFGLLDVVVLDVFSNVVEQLVALTLQRRSIAFADYFLLTIQPANARDLCCCPNSQVGFQIVLWGSISFQKDKPKQNMFCSSESCRAFIDTCDDEETWYDQQKDIDETKTLI